jgi:hypothetical protein
MAHRTCLAKFETSFVELRVKVEELGAIIATQVSAAKAEIAIINEGASTDLCRRLRAIERGISQATRAAANALLRNELMAAIRTFADDALRAEVKAHRGIEVGPATGRDVLNVST